MSDASGDEGHAVHYTAVARGTRVVASDGAVVGRVVRVLDNYREHILDGIVFEDADGELRFADGPEVARTFERAVHLGIPAAEALRLGPPADQALADRLRGALGRLLGR